MTTIIIAEKPDASMRIAEALADKNLKKKKSRYGVDYYEFERNGKKHIAVAAVGHLFNLKQVKTDKDYPVFDIDWIPSFKAIKKSAFSERYFRTIEEVAKNGSEYIISTDYDTEGSLIGYNILRFICKKNEAKRMLFSTLTKQDLVNSYENMSPHLDWNNIAAGETRHFLDYFYGISTSRALMSAIKKNSKRFAILSAGRVQAPTLVILADREMEIKNFLPKPYWQLQSILSVDGKEIIAFYENDRIWNKKEAEKIFNDCKGKSAIVDEVKKEKYFQPPPAPFNITSLQMEAYRFFGYSPQLTLKIAQYLYMNAFISYPRTSSEKLPQQIDYRGIIEALNKIERYKSICKLLLSSTLKPIEGKRTDPAHEAIHPTIEPPIDIKLPALAQKIYDLICRRFLSAFAKSAIRESTRIVFDISGYKFLAEGRITLEKGWMEFYGPYAKFDEITFPDLKKGDVMNVKKLDILNKKTAPPPRYSQASIIKELEKRNLGTRATRSYILQTLYDRNYITERNICVTDLGLRMASVIKEYVPDFADEKLTRKFEKDLEEIMLGKEKKEKIINKAKKAVTNICEEFKLNEDKIGKELGEAIIQMQDKRNIIGKCPNCGKDLKIMFSPKTRKYFCGCTGYKDGCRTAFPLPSKASFQRLDKTCDKCKTPIIKVFRKGRRPFSMCLSPLCETKADWGKPKVSKKKNF